MKARLVLTQQGVARSSEVELVDSSEALHGASDKAALSILRIASEGPIYSREIAKRLKMREQVVYYHVRKLVSLGMLKVSSTEQIRGALAKKVVTTSGGVAFLYDARSLKQVSSGPGSEDLQRFMGDFVTDGKLDAYVVVGSPEPHGAFRASARDGHYAAQLALSMGSFASVGSEFVVKLDTDAKVEMAYSRNMILVGGPATNLVTAEFNRYLPVKFDESNYWAGLVDQSGKRFSNETDAVIAKVRNPSSPGKHVITIAGIRHTGTKAAIIGLTQQPSEILKGYKGQESFACVVRGFDQDGDGKVDRADLIETYPPPS